MMCMTDYSGACAARIGDIEQAASTGEISQDERAQQLRYAALFYAGQASLECAAKEAAASQAADVGNALRVIADAIDEKRITDQCSIGLALLASLAIVGRTPSNGNAVH